MPSARSLAFVLLTFRAATVFPDAAVPVATPGPRAPECKTDADCRWRDPCAPKQCVAKKTAPEWIGCDKSYPARGTCGCIDHLCTYTPREYLETTSRELSCRSDGECGFDPENGRCVLGKSTALASWKGPRCTCSIDSIDGVPVPSGGLCTYGWPTDIPCKDWRDCSWVSSPRVYAVPSSVIPRPVAKPVRACRDGEHDSICENHSCRIIAWRC
jgi:hypothetical protein